MGEDGCPSISLHLPLSQSHVLLSQARGGVGLTHLSTKFQSWAWSGVRPDIILLRDGAQSAIEGDRREARASEPNGAQERMGAALGRWDVSRKRVHGQIDACG